MIKIPVWAIRLLNIADLMGAAPKRSERTMQQRRVEETANEIKALIGTCRTLAQTYGVQRMISNMQHGYGATMQVCGWADSLRLELYNKQKEIIERL